MSAQSLIIVKALEDGVTVLFTPGESDGSHQPERLDKGELMVLPNPERYPVIRVRGHAIVYAPDHKVEAESHVLIGGKR